MNNSQNKLLASGQHLMLMGRMVITNEHGSHLLIFLIFIKILTIKI